MLASQWSEKPKTQCVWELTEFSMDLQKAVGFPLVGELFKRLLKGCWPIFKMTHLAFTKKVLKMRSRNQGQEQRLESIEL